MIHAPNTTSAFCAEYLDLGGATLASGLAGNCREATKTSDVVLGMSITILANG